MAATEPSLLAEVVRRFRLTAALSQEELAKRSGLSTRAISDIERGLHKTPRLETVRMLADGLQLNDEQRASLLAAIHPELGSPARALQTGPPAINMATMNLPIPPTPLIGREQEMTHLLDRLLSDGNRLITLTGPGGVGKTRLALEVARRGATAFSHGAIFIDLAPVADPAQVASTIAGVFSIRESGERPIHDLLRTALASRHMLLLIDNFEQVIDAAPLISDLLAAAPQLHILATSREALHLRGESEFVVQPLDLPGFVPADLDALAQTPSVALFLQTARSVKPGFSLTSDNAPAVAEICRRLDGLPLAIELAAPRIKHLPPRALLEQLEQRLPFLSGGPRSSSPATNPARHDFVELPAPLH